jgi:hypothetical protein
MIDPDLQTLVDGVAADLDAAIGLVDPDEHLLVHSAHDNAVLDDVRRMGIMHRRISPEQRSWFEQWGYREATSPVHTPADKRLGVLERWCVPVRFRGSSLGFLWLIGHHKMTEEELAPAVEASDQIAMLLYRQRLLTQVDTDLLRLLLLPYPESEDAIGEVRLLRTYAQDDPIALVVVGTASDGKPSPDALNDLTVAVQRAGSRAPKGPILCGVISGLGILLAPLRTSDDLTPAKRLAENASRLAAHLADDRGIIAAIGSPAPLERASESYAAARRTFRMMQAMPDLGPIATWEELGVFRALALLPRDEAQHDVVDPRVRELLDDEGLAETAETFLDLAGDVQRTAAQMFIHRTTLYQRLDRIAALYKLDLRRNGDHRLITHLGLKLARLDKL